MRQWIIGVAICVLTTAWLFRPDNASAQLGSDSHLAAKVEQLERRVARLERAVMGRPAVSVTEAKAKLSAAESRRQFTEKLFRKGYISQLQLVADQFGVSRASKELQLAEAAAVGDMSAAELSAELEHIEAQFNLDVAQQQLDYAERMAAKGYVSLADVQAYQLAVEQAQKQLSHVEGKNVLERESVHKPVEPE